MVNLVWSNKKDLLLIEWVFVEINEVLSAGFLYKKYGVEVVTMRMSRVPLSLIITAFHPGDAHSNFFVFDMYSLEFQKCSQGKDLSSPKTQKQKWRTSVRHFLQ